jgi:DNA ligase-1
MPALFADIVAASRDVAASSSRLAKTERLADCLRGLAPTEVGVAVAYLSGQLPQGRIGIGGAALRDARPGSAADAPSLTLADADAVFDSIAALAGPGSAAERVRLLRELLARATLAEQDFLARLLFGELRQGAVQGVMLDAIARAAQVPKAEVRRAQMLTGDLPLVARTALADGRGFGLRRFRPIEPMLASSADDVAAALDKLGEAALEFKLDGARVQVHRSGDEVRVYTRRLNQVTEAVPELVEAVRALPSDDLVLDGEAIALNPEGRPLPFQTTMRRFGRRLDVERMRKELPLSVHFFDCLALGGETLLERPATERFAALERALPMALRVERIVTADPAEAADFVERSYAAGHEGVIAKALDAPYEAGRRGAAWLKVKRANTLDLVVLAAEWGSGRRRGWLSNLHLGARDAQGGGWTMLGKTFRKLCVTNGSTAFLD